ncbi:MAG: L-threonylcarbamoyladenylate synthase [bacterium]
MIIIKSLDKAVELLKQGKVLVFPTETSYGLGCDAVNQSAVHRIFQIKSRQKDKPLLVVVSTIDMAKKYLVWNKQIDKLAKKYWPGALTIVGQASRKLADGVTAPDNSLAVRVASHPMASFLSAKLGRPLVATSANISGQDNIYNIEEIKQIFSKRSVQPDAILDHGELPYSKPSTIIKFINNKIEVLRQGEVTLSLRA